MTAGGADHEMLGGMGPGPEEEVGLEDTELEEVKRGLVVTVKDLEHPHDGTEVHLEDDYLLICHGKCYRHQTQAYSNGTHVITIKRDP